VILIQKEHVLRDPGLIALCEAAISRDYGFFAGTYPGFAGWFRNRVLPGITTGDRTIVLEQRSDKVVGFLILKHTADERKLCTLRVREELQNRGLGIRLFETAFEILKSEKPLLSVADVNVDAFTKIFRYFNFANKNAYRDLYRPNSTEYAFNGELTNAAIIQRHRTTKAEGSVSKGPELFRQFKALPLIV
jgi:ribosomal protein S18 acetylase RimI-like enzyme